MENFIFNIVLKEENSPFLENESLKEEKIHKN